MKYVAYAAPMNVPSPAEVSDGTNFICPTGFIYLASGITLDQQGTDDFQPHLCLTGSWIVWVERALHPLLPVRLLLVGSGDDLYEGVTQVIYIPQAVLGSDSRFDPICVIGAKDEEIDATRRDFWFGPNIDKFTKKMGLQPAANADLWRS